MEIAVEKIAVIAFSVIGLSHIFQPRVWARFFIELYAKGEVGSFINAFIHFPLGALIVAFHNIWTGIPAVLTFIGYGLVLKSAVYFLFPRYGVQVLSRVTVEKSAGFIPVGVLMVAIAVLLLYSLAARP